MIVTCVPMAATFFTPEPVAFVVPAGSDTGGQIVRHMPVHGTCWLPFVSV